MDFDGSCSSVACLDVAEIGETISIRTESGDQPKFKECQLRKERLFEMAVSENRTHLLNQLPYSVVLFAERSSSIQDSCHIWSGTGNH